MSRKRIAVMNTAFGDGLLAHQGPGPSFAALLPALEASRAAGFAHFDVGAAFAPAWNDRPGGADPFAALDAAREAVGPEAELQLRVHAATLFGSVAQPREVLDLFAALCARHGVTTVRAVDPCGDPRTVAAAAVSLVEAGVQHELALAVVGLPPGASSAAHTPAFYAALLEALLDADVPFHSLCLEDVTGTTAPRVVHDTVRAARALLGADVPLRFHARDSAGLAVAQLLAAVEAGADAVDLSLGPVAGGGAPPSCASFGQALRGSGFELGLDPLAVLEAEAALAAALASGAAPPRRTVAGGLDPLFVPLAWPGPDGLAPSGDLDAPDRHRAIALRYGEVLARAGWPAPAPPVGEACLAQTALNVRHGPWTRLDPGYARLLCGQLGRPPQPADAEVVRLAAASLGVAPCEGAAYELAEADPRMGLAAAREALAVAGAPDTDELLLLAALASPPVPAVPPEAEATPDEPATAGPAVPSDALGEADGGLAEGPDEVTVLIEGRAYTVLFDGDVAVVDGQRIPYTVIAPRSLAGAR